jgi:aspartate kinase
VPAISFTGSQSGIITSSDHGRATITEIRPQRIQAALGEGKVVIIAGFQGVSGQKEITTLGRGGSDTTAVALAAVLRAEHCEILTDVEGIFSADPRIVPEARLFRHLSYEVCLEMASLGAKMQARSIALAKRYGVTVWIGSSQSDSGVSGTVVGTREVGENEMEESTVTAVTTKDGFRFFSMREPIERIAATLAEVGVVLRWFTMGPEGCSFLCEETYAEEVRRVVRQLDPGAREVAPVTLVSVVGEGLLNAPAILSQCLDSIASTEHTPLLIVSNSLSLSFGISEVGKIAVTQALHRRLM